MATIKQRIERLESKRDAVEGDLFLLTDAELENRIDLLLARMGSTQEQAIAEYGSHQQFAGVLRQQLEKHITLEENHHGNG